MQFDRLKRREFITLLGGVTAWPLGTRAQQSALPAIGFLAASSLAPLRRQIVAFHEGLKEAGYTDGQNVRVEARFAEGQSDRFQGLVSDLIGRGVAVLVVGGSAAVMAAKEATTTIPIVFTLGE